ncbi:MAG: zinc ABC transporter substrate-binding protein [Campylobacterales bacterium]|nr:zinc ABC transporter substrate-binding protein [Campylobacterales bacterium]
MKAFKTIVFLLILVVFFVQVYVTYKDDSEKLSPTKPLVAVSSFALYDVTKYIGAESIELINILPFGVDPHSFEPTPKLMAKIEKSNLVLYSGAGLEPWTHGFAFKNRAIEVSKHVVLRELGQDEEHQVDAEHHSHLEHEHTGVDPHFWLDFSNMQIVALLIQKELTLLNPDAAKNYEQRAKNYIENLQKLDGAYKERLSSCQLNVVVVNHNAIGYLAQNYGFHVEALTGLSPEAQPSPQDLTRIFDEIKKDHISTIFFENFVNYKAITTVATDANVSLEVLQPLGNITADEAKEGLSYEQIMYTNLEKISKALMCQ